MLSTAAPIALKPVPKMFGRAVGSIGAVEIKGLSRRIEDLFRCRGITIFKLQMCDPTQWFCSRFVCTSQQSAVAPSTTTDQPKPTATTVKTTPVPAKDTGGTATVEYSPWRDPGAQVPKDGQFPPRGLDAGSWSVLFR